MKPAVMPALLIALLGAAAGADSLRSTFESLRPRLESSAFGRPLVLESSETGGQVRGEVFSVVNHSLRAVSSNLDTPGEWCEVLILHLNVKSCGASQTGRQSSLQLILGTKRGNRADGGQPLAFRFRVVEASADRFRVTMQADDGPLGTHDYQLSLDATATAPGQSFLHLAYAYTFSTTARLAMNGYLHTLGENKVGFTVIGHGADGQPVHVGGVRGALERNTMRYYLGMETFLASAARRPPGDRRWRLSTWFDATEKHARQLHELGKDEYLAGKAPEPGGSGQ